MTESQTVATLSRLYTAEYGCPTARLAQSMPYVSWAQTGEGRALRKIALEDHEHQGWLVNLLLDHGGAPPPAGFPTYSAELHFVRLESLVPRLIAAERELLSVYHSAAPDLAADRDAARVVANIAQRHTAHLAAFETLLRRN